MKTRLAPYRFFLLVVIILLAACGTRSPGQLANTPTSSVTDLNGTPLSGARTEVAQTMTAIPTSTVVPTDTLLPPTPTRTRLPFMALDGLRVVYTTRNGNLYVWDSGKQAIQLAEGVKESTKYHPPLISDDGQKVIFYRAGEAQLDSVYVINADGTGEEVLVNPELLSAFGSVYDEFTSLFSLAFVPGTHLLLFNTYQQSNFDPESAGWLPLVGNDLFVVDTDTGKLKQLKAPWQGGNFLAAPNAKWIAVQTLDHIDVIDVQGQIIHANLVTYTKSEGHVVVPMYWTPDSRELIILPSGIPLFAGVTVVRTVWRYPLSGGPGIEIKLDPSPVWDAYTVSPDGNWIAYGYDQEVTEVSPGTTAGVYLGNLHDGTSQLIYVPEPDQATGRIDIPYSYHDWSPDSVNFAFHNSSGRISMGNVHGEIAPLGRGEGILGWIDSTHYVLSNGVVGDVENIIVPDDYIYYDPIAFVYLRH